MKKFFLTLTLFSLQTFKCPEITVRTPANTKEFGEMQQKCRLMASNLDVKQFLFPIINSVFRDNTQINPSSGPYSEEHLKMLVVLDRWGRKGSLTFETTIQSLKTALGVGVINWNYLACRSGIKIDGKVEAFEMCWLNALVNAARFYDQSLLEEKSVLNNNQWIELVTLLLTSIDKFHSDRLDPKQRYKKLVLALKEAFEQDKGFMSAALVTALFKNLTELGQKKSKDALINRYLDAICKLIGQCVQIPQVRSGSPVLLDLNIAPILFMTDKKALVENPDSQVGQEEQMITHVLRIDPSQALSQEQWGKFKAGTLPLILFFTLSHNIAPGSGTKCPDHSNRPETPHVVAIRMGIEDQTLHLEIIDSSSHDPLNAPSFIPGVLVTFNEFVQQAKSKRGEKPNLLSEARLKEYADYLGNLGQFNDKTFPAEQESLEPLKRLLASNFTKWERLPTTLAQAKAQYNSFLDFLEQTFELLPDGVRFNYAESFFTNGTWINRTPEQRTVRTSLLPFNLRWEEIGKIFEMGIGLPKEKKGFIGKVFKWRDQTPQNPNPFSSLQFSFTFGTGLENALNNKLIMHTFGSSPFPEHLKTCPECQVLLEQAEVNDRERFSQWDRPPDRKSVPSARPIISPPAQSVEKPHAPPSVAAALPEPQPPAATTSLSRTPKPATAVPRLSPRHTQPVPPTPQTNPLALPLPVPRSHAKPQLATALPEPQSAAVPTSPRRRPMTTPVQLPTSPVPRPLTVTKTLQRPEPLPKVVNIPPEPKIHRSRPSREHFRMSIRRHYRNGNLEIIEVRNKQKAIEELRKVLAQIKLKRATEQKTEEITKLEALIEKLIGLNKSKSHEKFHLSLRSRKPTFLNPS